MSNSFHASLIVTTILVVTSVIGRLWLIWLWEARDEGGSFIVGYFWLLLTILMTVPSVLITLGMWIARKIRKPPEDQSLHL